MSPQWGESRFRVIYSLILNNLQYSTIIISWNDSAHKTMLKKLSQFISLLDHENAQFYVKLFECIFQFQHTEINQQCTNTQNQSNIDEEINLHLGFNLNAFWQSLIKYWQRYVPFTLNYALKQFFCWHLKLTNDQFF